MPYKDTEKLQAYAKAYRESNRETLNAKRRAHPEYWEVRYQRPEVRAQKSISDKAYYKSHRDNKLVSFKKRYAAHPERFRSSQLRRDYGLTLEAFEAMLRGQGGKCAVCHAAEWGQHGGPCVDHDHKTGAVRGLLCRKCNLAAGMLGDDPERAKNLAAYLEGHGTKK